jgi:hypothetical protein
MLIIDDKSRYKILPTPCKLKKEEEPDSLSANKQWRDVLS